MKIICEEYHSVTRILTYNIDEEIIQKDWDGSMEELEAAITDESHPRHYEATDLMYQYGHDEEDEDWVSDSKGGYDVNWSIEDER